jgi:sialidase-1
MALATLARRFVILAAAFGFAYSLCFAPAIAAESSVPESQALWTSGQNGYHTYRIPSLIVTKAGTLLAFCEGRVNSGADSGKIHLLVRRSTDGGKTWSPQQVVWSDGDNTCGNPCPIVDQQTGTIWLPMTHNIGTDKERDIVGRTGKGTRGVWMTHSDDDGQTWAKPSEITSAVKPPEWTWYATGPGVGIQLQLGKYRGRMVVPCDYKLNGGGFSHVIYSDDHGKSWQLGGSVPSPTLNECQMVELTDGRLMLNCRNHRDLKTKHPAGWRRMTSFSDDGGLTWSAPERAEDLVEPVCQASLIRCFPAMEKDRPWLLFTNPADEAKRRSLTVRLSKDDGKTWPHSKVLYHGSASYSCLAMLPSGEVACLYERDGSQEIALAKFSLDWLDSQP